MSSSEQQSSRAAEQQSSSREQPRAAEQQSSRAAVESRGEQETYTYDGYGVSFAKGVVGSDVKLTAPFAEATGAPEFAGSEARFIQELQLMNGIRRLHTVNVLAVIHQILLRVLI